MPGSARGKWFALAGLVIAILLVGCLYLISVRIYDVPIDPRRSYLRIDASDRALDAEPIALADLGLKPGDRVRFQVLGTFQGGKGETTQLGGVFSRDGVILPASEPHRLPGAIDAGPDHPSITTYYGDLPTDIPEDFYIDDVAVRAPPQAAYIFIAPPDRLFADNHDRDGDFAVRLIKLPAPWMPRFLQNLLARRLPDR